MESILAIPSKRNIEIKARIADHTEFEKRVKIAKDLTNTEGEVIPQHDVFFNVPNGRLKLRYEKVCLLVVMHMLVANRHRVLILIDTQLQNGNSMLIQYNRPDATGPKLSEFNILETDDPKMLHQILELSIGVLGEVKKERWLFNYEQTRIHLDKVEGLGTFLEFEVCLRPAQTIEDGKIIADKLSELFHIRPEDLMAGAYLDELLPK